MAHQQQQQQQDEATTNRDALLGEIYDKTRGEAFKDLRNLKRPSKMALRLNEIDGEMVQLMASAGTMDDKKTQKRYLETERTLLTQKYELYSDSPNIPLVRNKAKKFLRLTDLYKEDRKETRSESMRNKRQHTIVLMHYAYVNHSPSELRALRDSY
jgi:hypothetical protein